MDTLNTAEIATMFRQGRAECACRGFPTALDGLRSPREIYSAVVAAGVGDHHAIGVQAAAFRGTPWEIGA